MPHQKIRRSQIIIPVVGVTGGRDYKDGKRVWQVLDTLRKEIGEFFLVNGDAPGADTLTTKWCEARGVDYRLFPAAWECFGAAAGPKRNKEMRDFGLDYLIAFPPGPKPNSGTRGMVKLCKDYVPRDRIIKIDWPSDID